MFLQSKKKNEKNYVTIIVDESNKEVAMHHTLTHIKSTTIPHPREATWIGSCNSTHERRPSGELYSLLGMSTDDMRNWIISVFGHCFRDPINVNVLYYLQQPVSRNSDYGYLVNIGEPEATQYKPYKRLVLKGHRTLYIRDLDFDDLKSYKIHLITSISRTLKVDACEVGHWLYSIGGDNTPNLWVVR